MAEVRAQIDGVLAKFKVYGARVDENVANALEECAALVANAAKENHPKVGDQFMGRHADVFRPLNTDGSYRFLTRTGNLVQSILPRRAVKTGRVWSAKIVSGMDYSDRIEYGSPENRPFPFMRPALEQVRPELLRRVTLAVQRSIGG